MKQFTTILLLIIFAIGCERDTDNSTAESNSGNDRTMANSIEPNETKPHPTELLARLRSFTGENNVDSIMNFLDIDLTQYEEMDTGQSTISEYKLNDVFFLRRSTAGTTFQNGKPVWIYCTEK